jgi:hypothetical protein
MNKLLIKDKHELLTVAFDWMLRFDIIDYLIVRDHQAMYHFDIEYIYSVIDRFVYMKIKRIYIEN